MLTKFKISYQITIVLLMPLVPVYLIVPTFVLVVIPSVGAFLLRLALYQHLVFLQDRVRRLIKKQSGGQKPRILEELEKRFEDARESLDQVNTAALIDQVYSREKVWLFSCDQIDYFCRILPNLLLSFGLLGTFLGITINLAALSQTINQTTGSNVSSLVAQLEKPLQGMSIAFITSLTGLLFSALLTVVNLIKNTSLAKYQFISSLEDYLDNVYQPTIDGYTRLDILINRMVGVQNEFLINFGNNVREVVEQSLGGVAKEIAEENKKANQLARQVYEGFTQASGIIGTAATEFKISSEEMKAKVEIFKQASETFDKSQFPQKLSAATEDLASTQEKFSQSAASLAETVAELHLSSQQLLEMGTEISSINKTSVKVLEAHQSNHQSLFEIIPPLKKGAESFDSAITKIDQLEQRIVNKADSFNGVEVALKQLLETVISYTDQVNYAIESLGDRLILNISEKMTTNNQHIQTIITTYERHTNQLNIITDTLKLDFMELLRDNNVRLTGEYKNVGDRLFTGIKYEAEISIKNSRLLAGKIQECSKQLAEIKQEIYQLGKAQPHNDLKNHATVDDLADFSDLFSN